MLKTTTLALTLTAALTLSATAGGISEPIMEPEIVIQETQTQSSIGASLPFILFALLAVAAGSN